MIPEVVDTVKNGRLRWFVVAFVLAGALMSVLLAWQLGETTPKNWCILAKQGSPELAGSCVTILLHLLDIKDHVVIGLLAIVGLSVLSLAVVALGVRISAEGPGGLKANVDIQASLEKVPDQ